MNPISLEQIATWCSARLLPTEAAKLDIKRVSTDTRALTAGSLFVALRGERYDGHEFLAQAAEAGSVAAMVERGVVSNAKETGMALLEVGDTLDALQCLAAGYRQTLRSPVIGVTGSSGKTSTKEMLRCVLGTLGKVQATRGNLNNHIGLPLSVLEGDDLDAAHIWEMGMNHPGEIAPLAAIAAPQAGVITNIGTAHIENMGSREAIAREKGELIAALPESGLAVLPADDDFLDLLRELAPCRQVSAGFDAKADYRVEDFLAHANGSSFVLVTPHKNVSMQLPTPGRHMAANAALAAAAACELCAIEPTQVAASLADLHLSGGRLSIEQVGERQIIDDSYNANPESMAAGLKVLAEMPPPSGVKQWRRVAVLGGLAEQGEREIAAYRRMADLAGSLGVDVLHVVGAGWCEALAQSPHLFELHRHEQIESCLEFFEGAKAQPEIIFVKGSRLAGMERLVELLRGQALQAR